MGQHRRTTPAGGPTGRAGRLAAVVLGAQLLSLPTAAGLAVDHAPAATPSAATAAARVPDLGGGSTSTWVRRSATELPSQSGRGRRIVYSLTGQRVWIVGGAGHVQRTYLVSGRLSQPGPGRYRVYSKSRWTTSAVSAEVMQYMVRFTHGRHTGAPIGFHSIPTHHGRPAQSTHQLGRPLSAGCVRQRLGDAAYLYRFAHVGTRVVVVR